MAEDTTPRAPSPPVAGLFSSAWVRRRALKLFPVLAGGNLLLAASMLFFAGGMHDLMMQAVVPAILALNTSVVGLLFLAALPRLRSEAMVERFAENSVVGVYIAQNGRFRFVNRKMAAMFGYRPGEMVDAVPLLDLVPESEREKVQEHGRRRAAGELPEVRYERRARRKDGSLFDVEVVWSLMEFAGGKATIGIMLDVSERKRLERALRVLSACNRALVRATDEDALLQEVCNVVRDVSGYPFVWVGFAADDQKQTVRPVALAETQAGAMQSLVQRVRWSDTPLGNGVTGSAIRRGEPVVILDMQNRDVLAPWRDFMTRNGIVSAMSLPLRAGLKCSAPSRCIPPSPGCSGRRRCALRKSLPTTWRMGSRLCVPSAGGVGTRVNWSTTRATMLLPDLPTAVCCRSG